LQDAELAEPRPTRLVPFTVAGAKADICRAAARPLHLADRARRQGLGAVLMRAAEAMACDCGKTLLVLDAVTGGDAARLYERLGWVRVGISPRMP